MKKFWMGLAAAVLMAGLLTGCGDGVDENKPLAEINAEAVKMDRAALEKQIAAYKTAIAAKADELKAEAAKLQEIPLTQILGDEAKAIKGKMAEISASAEKLTERMEAYIKAMADQK